MLLFLLQLIKERLRQVCSYTLVACEIDRLSVKHLLSNFIIVLMFFTHRAFSGL